MKQALILPLLYLLLPGASSFGASTPDSISSPSRFDAALDSAAIREHSLATAWDDALLLGNGDINALLYAGGSGLQLRITKNDVWDARIDASHDPETARIDVANHKVTGAGGDPPSWGPPYPCPLTCALLNLTSEAAVPEWHAVRSEGKTNGWAYDGKQAVMSIEGKAGASCGWETLLTSPAPCNKVRLRISGTPNARHYLVVGRAQGGQIESGWKDTPTAEQDVYFNLPEGTVVTSLILYAWTNGGAQAENRYSAIELQGPSGNRAIDLAQVTPPAADYKLDIKHAVATVPGKSKAASVSIRALADRNVFLIEGETTVTLQPTTAGFVPKAERETRDGIECLAQKLPADPGYPNTGDWPGMSFAVAKATAGIRTAVAIVTSLESRNPEDDAIALARSTLAAEPDALRQEHEKIWERFWAGSRIDLADTYLRDVWYRNLYFMRSVCKPGGKPAALFASLTSDSAAWHGDFHLNYNAEQTYWGWYACNHGELSEPYERLISRDLTKGKWFARRVYNCDGAFFPYNIFMHEPVDPALCKSKNGRQISFIPYTYTLGVDGWAVQNLWLHYKFYPSRQLLATNVYPLLKEVALFYSDFADKCKTNPAMGKIVFGPTYSPEHWGMGRDNGTCDIAFSRMALKAAIESAATLGVDGLLASHWQQTLDKLPEYPQTTGSSPVIVDVADAPPTQYNVPVPELPVYPAGEVTWFSPEAEKTIFGKTIAGMSTNGNNDLIIQAGARDRLSLPDAYSWIRDRLLSQQCPNGTLSLAPKGGSFNGYGIYTEEFAASGVITEMLLQSVDDIVRVFPAWPSGQNAAFEALRAQGGYLVNAEQKDGKVARLEITSTVGGKLRLISPWPAISANGHQLVPDAHGIVEIATEPRERLMFSEMN